MDEIRRSSGESVNTGEDVSHHEQSKEREKTNSEKATALLVNAFQRYNNFLLLVQHTGTTALLNLQTTLHEMESSQSVGAPHEKSTELKKSEKLRDDVVSASTEANISSSDLARFSEIFSSTSAKMENISAEDIEFLIGFLGNEPEVIGKLGKVFQIILGKTDSDGNPYSADIITR